MAAASTTVDPTVTESALLDGAMFYQSEQPNVNAAIHQAVLDAHEAVSGLRVNLRDELNALRKASEAATERAGRDLLTFEQEVKAPFPVSMKRDELVAAAQLQVEGPFLDGYRTSNAEVESFFERYHDRPAGSPSASVRAPFDAASPEEPSSPGGMNDQQQVQPSPNAMAASLSETGSNQMAVVANSVTQILAELRHDRTRLPRRNELIAALRTIGDTYLPLGDDGAISRVLALLELEAADPLRVTRAELTKHAQKLAALDGQLHEGGERRTAALQEEDIPVVESLSDSVLAMHQDVLDRIRERIRLTTDSAVDVDDFLAEVEGERSIHATLDSLHNKAVELEKLARGDRELVGAYRKAVEKDAAEEKAQFDVRTSNFRGNLNGLAADERSVWNELLATVVRLDAIHERREALVAERLKEAEAERIRHAVVKAREAACTKQTAALDVLVANLQGAEELLATLRERSTRAFAAIERRKWPDKQAAMVLDECVRYHAGYNKFVLFAGEIAHRAEQRQANVGRLLRSVEFQAANATDTLDADLPVYREQQRKLTAALQHCDTRLRKLREVQRTELDMWLPVSAELDENDVDFDPPELGLQQLQRDLTASHVAAVDDLTNEEQRIVDHEKRQARSMATLCDATRATLEEKRHTRSAARLQQAKDHPPEEQGTASSPDAARRKLDLN